MPLRPCPDCEKPISTTATWCPNCGAHEGLYRPRQYRLMLATSAVASVFTIVIMIATVMIFLRLIWRD